MGVNSNTTIGLRVSRVDVIDKVTGDAKYAADIHLPGMLWGAALRSPHPHARIRQIDASRALKDPGVLAVLTGIDVRHALFGRSISDIPAIAFDRVRFVGEPVAAIAAVDQETAEGALGLIEVDYEELPAVFDPIEAMQPDAPLLHPDYPSYRGANMDLPDVPNLCSYELVTQGDIEVGFREADLVLEHTYRTPMQHQGYLEPHTCLVSAEHDGTIRIWASNKAPFNLRDRLARDLGIPIERIVVEPTYTGGDFGGKATQMQVPLAYFLSQAAGHPVRMILSGTEEFTAANPRHPAWITIRSGVKNDGTMLARHIKMVFSGGAYAGHKPIAKTHLAAFHYLHGVYRIPHFVFESQIAYTNHVPCGHMRSPGGQQGVFAVEADVDRQAEALGMDPLDFRLRNAVTDGDPGPEGTPLEHARLRECLEAVRSNSGWDRPKTPYVGRGVAVAPGKTGAGQSSATLNVHQNGTATLTTGFVEQGVGAHSMMQQVVANELQLPLGMVKVDVAGTDSGLWDRGGTASAGTHGAGQAALGAARDVLRKLTSEAATYLECPVKRVVFVDGAFLDPEGTSSSVSFADVVKHVLSEGRLISGFCKFNNSDKLSVFSYVAEVAEVEVDPETGHVDVRRVTAACDVGTILNPLAVEGQIEGGLIMGFGTAMMEEVRMDDGRVETVGLHDYKLPTLADVPEFEYVFIEGGSDGHGPGPYGAKECSELSNNPLPPAIANAVFDAISIRIDELPITAERVWTASESPWQGNRHDSLGERPSA